MKRTTWLWGMVVVLLVATALRLVAFGETPPGLYHDEAIHGLDALDVLNGQLEIYFPANNGREPLFIYLVAMSVGVFGRSPFAVRLPAAFAGILTVAVTAAMARALFSRRVGLFSAAVLSLTLWHVHLSRTGYRAVLLPLFSALAIWQGAMGVRRGRWRSWLACGVFLGLSAYTYTAARMIPIALAAFAVYAWAAWPQVRALRSSDGRRLWRGVGLAALSATVVGAPLIAHALLRPDDVLGRLGQVSVLTPEVHGGAPWTTLGSHVLRTLGMWFVRGDRIWRHNVPWRPVFDPLLGVAFLAGLVVALRRLRRDAASALVVLWTGAMLLPTILAEDAPHFLRAVGVLPVAAVLPALGLDWMASAAQRWLRRREAGGLPASQWYARVTVWLIVAIPLLLGLASTARAYFGPYASDPMTAFWFEEGAAELAGRVNAYLGAGWNGSRMVWDASGDRDVTIDPRLWDDWPQLRFLVSDEAEFTIGTAPREVDSDAAAFAWPYTDWEWVWSVLPSPREVTLEPGAMSQGDRDPEPYRTYVAAYGETPDSSAPAVFRFSHGVEFLGAEVVPAGSDLLVRLRWRATQPVVPDFTVFLHYLRDGELVGQHDSLAAGGLYSTSRWQSGDVINDDHMIEGVGEVVPGRDSLRFGLWQPDSGEVLYLLDEAGSPAADWAEVPVRAE